LILLGPGEEEWPKYFVVIANARVSDVCPDPDPFPTSGYSYAYMGRYKTNIKIAWILTKQ
jgi:hypothetical protein